MNEMQRRDLEAYLAPSFAPVNLDEWSLPVADEAHVAWWRRHFEVRGGTATALVEALTQLQFSPGEGVSGSDAYAKAIRAGQPIADPRTAKEIFTVPESIEWSVVDHPAGGLPVAAFGDRSDFEQAYRAIGFRCEPVPVGPHVHALYVGGLPNPVRLRDAKAEFDANGNASADWPIEMRRLRELDATAFHDRLVLLHPAPYAGISASRVGLDEDEWVEASMRLRIEHELTHHATHRLLGRYRLHVHDEVLADLMGFTAAIGRFDGALFLDGLGIGDDGPGPDARLLTYTDDLDPKHLPELVDLLRAVAVRVESLSTVFVGIDSTERLNRLVRMASYDLILLARGDVRPSDLVAARSDGDGLA